MQPGIDSNAAWGRDRRGSHLSVRLEFFFDCSSPWTYLAFHRIQSVAAETDTTILWRPILVGGVFNAINPGVYTERAKIGDRLRQGETTAEGRKAKYYIKDLADWARLSDLKIGQPSVFPVNSVRVMRACFVAEEHGRLIPFARAAFEAYWGELKDLSQDDVLMEIAGKAGLDAEEIFKKIVTPDYKQRLRNTTDELMERGGFGSPTIFIDESDMYFGNDRLEVVADVLRRRAGELDRKGVS